LIAPPELFDTHAHLDMPQFAGDLAGIMARARQAGVERFVTIGIDLASSRKAIELARTNPGVSATAGIHPESAGKTSQQDIDKLAELAKEPGVVAIGEIGLDFYHDYAPAEKQIEVFRRQLELASRLRLPAVIHSRKAEKEVTLVLKEWLGSFPSDRPGIIHCFNESLETAETYLKMGFYISLGSYIGYPSAKAIREVVKCLPAERLVLETDCPFLPPQSHRGERNEPAYIAETARELAMIKGIGLEEVAKLTSDNARAVFGIGA